MPNVCRLWGDAPVIEIKIWRLEHRITGCRLRVAVRTMSVHGRLIQAIVSPSRAGPVSPDDCYSYEDDQAHWSRENPPELQRPVHQGFSEAATTFGDRWSNWHRGAGTLAEPMLLLWIP